MMWVRCSEFLSVPWWGSGLPAGASDGRVEVSQAAYSEVAVEFAEVVAGGEQVPLAAGVVQAAEQDVFALQGGDMTADRLDDRLA